MRSAPLHSSFYSHFHSPLLRKENDFMTRNQFQTAGRVLAAITVTLVVVLMLVPAASAQGNSRSTPLWTKAEWATWKSWDGNNPGTVVGTIVIDRRKITVTYTGEVRFVQLKGNGTNYYLPTSTFSCATVPNAPKGGNMIAISGTADPHTFTFSVPVRHPVMAIVSLGQYALAVDYNFSALPKILVQGPEQYFGGGSDNLKIIHKKTLRGNEGDGLVELSGRSTSFSWTVGNGEYWNGFTVGVPPPSTED
jgi:hypothetical protein